MAGDTSSSPWGLLMFSVFCIVMALAGLIWCVCCGTCAGRNMMRQAGLGRLVPPPFMQPSFGGRGRRRKEYGQDELDEEALVGSRSNHHHDHDDDEDRGWWQRANEQTEQISMRVFGRGEQTHAAEGDGNEDQDGYHSSVEYGYDLSDDD